MSVKVIIGPMFAGKTTALCNEFSTAKKRRSNCILITHKGAGQRYPGVGKPIVTHDQKSMDATECTRLSDIRAILDGYDEIYVDEVQFLEDASEVLGALAKDGKKVTVAGLSGDYLQRPFPVVAGLIALADEVLQLRSRCVKCHELAIFTHRLPHVQTTQVKHIAGPESYRAYCRSCLPAQPAEPRGQEPQQRQPQSSPRLLAGSTMHLSTTKTENREATIPLKPTAKPQRFPWLLVVLLVLTLVLCELLLNLTSRLPFEIRLKR